MSLGQKLIDYNKKAVYPFHMPGHKRRLSPLPQLTDAFSMDITEIEGFDDLHDAQGILRDAQMKAARVFGADSTFFLVNSTTSGNLAAICGLVKQGDIVLMARNCHKSVYNAVMLSGATPMYLYPEREAFFDINSGITPDQVKDALVKIEADRREAERAAQKANEKAENNEVFNNKAGARVLVVITSPTYEGVVSDIEGIKKICKRYKALLLVDAAHGAHFGFSEGFPKTPSSYGADIEIISLHKTLPAPTQTALIHIDNEVRTVDFDRIRYYLSVFQSSSPSYILMAGIDACVDYLDKNAEKAFKEYEEKLDDFIAFSETLINISVLTKNKLLCEGSFDFDKGKIVISDKTGRFSGRELFDFLLNTYNIMPEMSSGNFVVLMTSIADDSKGFYRLKEALTLIDKAIEDGSDLQSRRNIFSKLYDKIVGYKVRRIAVEAIEAQESIIPPADKPIKIETAVSTKDVLFSSEKRFVKIGKSTGKISASLIMLYPPGIPLVTPGEIISEEIADKIMESLGEGLNVIGLKDNKEIEVLWEK